MSDMQGGRRKRDSWGRRTGHCQFHKDVSDAECRLLSGQCFRESRETMNETVWVKPQGKATCELGVIVGEAGLLCCRSD